MYREKTFLERRQELFLRLKKVINDLYKNDDTETMLYILDLWRYIADEHGESFSIEVDK